MPISAPHLSGRTRRTLLKWSTLVAAPLAGQALTEVRAQGQWQGQAQAPAPVAVAPEVAALWPAALLQGQGRLRFFGLAVYDIRLWSARGRIGADDWDQRALALEIEYRRALVGRQIAERSLEEMRRAGPVEAASASRWLQTMTRLFPDVNAGDRITGRHDPGVAAEFFVNGSPRGEVRDAQFARLFFGIWLAPWTSEPKLRSALLGAA